MRGGKAFFKAISFVPWSHKVEGHWVYHDTHKLAEVWSKSQDRGALTSRSATEVMSAFSFCTVDSPERGEVHQKLSPLVCQLRKGGRKLSGAEK